MPQHYSDPRREDNMPCTCKVGPGKFEGEPALAFLAYEQMLLGNADETIDRVDFFKHPFCFNADQSVVKAARDYGYCAECIENHDDGSYGCSVYEDDYGFVYVQTYATAEEYDAAIAEALADAREGCDDDDE